MLSFLSADCCYEFALRAKDRQTTKESTRRQSRTRLNSFASGVERIGCPKMYGHRSLFIREIQRDRNNAPSMCRLCVRTLALCCSVVVVCLREGGCLPMRGISALRSGLYKL